MTRVRAQFPVLLSCLLFAMVTQAMLPLSSAGLKYQFYRYTCPKAERIVKAIVHKAVSEDIGLAAGLIRLHFHDCFVRGCDASILLDPTPEHPNTEKTAPPNDPSLEGFDLVDKVKTVLEHYCPGVVSCADIIAFAARDATELAGGVSYAIPAGRLDGRVSIAAEANLLPGPSDHLHQLISDFKLKGLNVEDLVVLSGAHSIGDSHCSSFLPRLQPGTPSIDQSFAADLRKTCPSPASGNATVDQDIVTPDVLDNQYYKNLEAHKVLFNSDSTLLTSEKTAELVSIYAKDQGLWETKFGAAMVKMGHIGVRTGKGGEVRKSCRVVN